MSRDVRFKYWKETRSASKFHKMSAHRFEPLKGMDILNCCSAAFKLAGLSWRPVIFTLEREDVKVFPDDEIQDIEWLVRDWNERVDKRRPKKKRTIGRKFDFD